MGGKGIDRNQSGLRPGRRVAVAGPVVVPGCADPARLMELCYWSEEPGILEIIRGVVAMTSATQAAFRHFLSLAPAAQLIVAVAGHSRELTLSVPTVSKATKVPRHPVSTRTLRQGFGEQRA